MKTRGWRFWVDRGGTFTDIVAVDPRGQRQILKVLSVSTHYDDAIVEGIRRAMCAESGGQYDPQQIEEIRIGTTVATNAFLERRGQRTALVTTLGFRDILEIRAQNRPRLFDLHIQKIPPLYDLVTEVLERTLATGKIEIPLNEEIALYELQRLKDLGVKSLAVAFMHATINPDNELAMLKLAKRAGFENISLSHQISQIAKLVPRAETCVVDAYLNPVLSSYTSELQAQLNFPDVLFMQSHGGLCKQQEFRGCNALLSGPAGGLVGAVRTCKEAGFEKVITFDMGGTSTDVAIFDGAFRLNHEPEFHGISLQTPMLDIHTVAAGGGSIITCDSRRLKVGPESAGAAPGPACYRNGGPLTLTDVNFYLGRIESGNFPCIFGPHQNQPPDLEIVEAKLNEIAAFLGQSPREVAQGCLEVAIETMTGAIRKVSVEKGHDPREFTLCCFGGAGPQIACLVADRLGIRTVFIHEFSSVLSAYGMDLAEEKIRRRVGLMVKLDEMSNAEVESRFANLIAEVDYADQIQRFFHLGVKSSDFTLEIPAVNLSEAGTKFSREHAKIFGIAPDSEIYIYGLSVELGSSRNITGIVSGVSIESKIEGHSVIAGNNTSVVIDPGWEGISTRLGQWVLRKMDAVTNQQVAVARGGAADLEIFYQRFQSIAEEMGFVLKNTGYSVNIKERLDFSCAIFTKECELIANAPHIPVHLGSMSESIRMVDRKFAGQMHEGDSFITNRPDEGGTHLPDITVVTPIFYAGHLIFYVASRGHHADVGGKSPGSMPSDSRLLSEEGVLISVAPLVRAGKFMLEEMREVFASGPYPARHFQQNMHDLKAQLAANQRGKQSLLELVEIRGVESTLQMAEFLLSYTQSRLQEYLQKFTSGSATVVLDQGRTIQVRLTKAANNKLLVDFTGTSPTDSGNFNAPPAVVKAAVLYVLRCLLREEIPLNDGFSRSMELIIPGKSLLSPHPTSAVVAGNVETSQAICDALFAAFGELVHSQGTMNNFSFGNERLQYYETLGGGSGAGPRFNGASCIQVHMTNSRLTDPEVLENRFPVKVDLFSRRHGSGGKGLYQGGDGLYRRLTFFETMTVNVLSQRRETVPQGLHGGGDALAGINRVERAQGEFEIFGPCFQRQVLAGDCVNIETPGGGGFGKDPHSALHLVFSYGSNLDPLQMLMRCPDARIFGRARLFDHELGFTRFSPGRGGGVADVLPSIGHTVWGLVYRLNDQDMRSLDEAEDFPRAYNRVEKSVQLDNGEMIQAWTYQVVDRKSFVQPTRSYLWQIYRGGYLLNAPRKYLNNLFKHIQQ